MTKLRKNHKFLSVGGHIKQICKPLQHLHTHMFTYMKNFHDGTQINVSSDPKWIADYYALELHNSSFFEGDPSQYASGFKWWPEGSDLPVFTHGRDYYNSHYGITYCQQLDDGCEFFFFSSGKENAAMLDTYLNNLDLLERFVMYFKNRAEPILKKCKQHHIVRSASTNLITPATNNIDRELFLRTKGIDNEATYMFMQHFERLTEREKECLEYLVKESSNANIASAMNISIRTVETHIDRIKNKLQCRTRHELIIKLLSLVKRPLCNTDTGSNVIY